MVLPVPYILSIEFCMLNLKTHWNHFLSKYWYKNTVVKPRTLDPRMGWVDKDVLLLHCMFEILCKFVEDEMFNNDVDWDADEEHKAAKNKLLDLYNWWTVEYEEYSPWSWEAEAIRDFLGITDPTVHTFSVEQMFKAETKYNDNIKAKCKELIDVSPYMWT